MYRLVLGLALSLTAHGKTEWEIRKGYEFTSNWFHSAPQWETALKTLKGKTSTSYLEIGVYEGRSFFWVLDHLLTDKSSTAVAIDIFPDDLKQRFERNLKISGHKDRVTIHAGKSEAILPKLKSDSFDLIYIDGEHTMRAVLTDFILSWPLLKTGGYLVFDDYLWEKQRLPPELRPETAIDAVLLAYRSEVEVVHRGYQVIVRKRELPAGGCRRCSEIGSWVYNWGNGDMQNTTAQKSMKLSEAERVLLEKILHARDPSPIFSQPGSLPAKHEKEAIKLMNKLGLQAQPTN